LKNKIKIIATIGPASFDKGIITKMDRSGVDIFRVNLSHTNIKDYKKIVNQLSKWTSKPICPDTEGAQLRTGNIKSNNGLKILSNKILEIVGSNYKANKNQLSLNTPNIEKLLKIGDLLNIDFNGVLLHIVNIDKKIIYGRIINGGIIYSNKGINVNRDIDLPSLTKKDLSVIKITSSKNIPIIFLSFCSNGESIDKLRSYFNYNIQIISKVESKIALKNLDEICKKSDGILIDRGDLSRDVPIERIAFAQNHILEKAGKYKTPVYVATNFLESMIDNPQPTRSEINDIVSTLEKGGSGIVLAAETAIGKFPLECVRMVSNVIKEHQNFKKLSYKNLIDKPVDYLVSEPTSFLIKPHGGNKLVNQKIDLFTKNKIKQLPHLKIDEEIISDIIQIAEGVYSPLKGFMDLSEINSVLNDNLLLSNVPWTLPIIFQLKKNEIKKLPEEGEIIFKSKIDNQFVGVLNIQSIEKIDNMQRIALKWFQTDDNKHPGVKRFLDNGEYILSGGVYLFKEYRQKTKVNYEFSPNDTREIFYQNGWQNIIGFHTRNLPHKGHEYIQKLALEKSSSDAILISPVTGIKKKGDLSAEIIIKCYEILIREGFYSPSGVLLSSFNTFSRYSGPREAVFTAICRKNFGCNYFIVGRDHTGVGNYYNSNASQIIFDSIDLDMNILFFDKASYCKKRKKVTTQFANSLHNNYKMELSGTIIREMLKKHRKIPKYIIDPLLADYLKKIYNKNSSKVFFVK